jgi:ornithine carbamoyltransferase
MTQSLKKRSLLTLNEFSDAELRALIDRAIECKRLKRSGVFPRHLLNKNICGIFLKPSGRTSASFVVASSDEGAHFQFFPAEDIRFGQKESVKDFARLVGRLFDGIAFRGYEHEVIEKLAQYAGIPVWNALTDTHHPTQTLADVMTFKEEFGEVEGLRISYLGDGRNNTVTSLAIGALKFGYHLVVVSPPELQPGPAMRDGIYGNTPERRGSIAISDDVAASVAGADVVYTDVWVSMGERVSIEDRIRLLIPYKVTREVMAATGKERSIFMHCLPSLHDLETEMARAHPDLIEVEDEVFEDAQSRVFDQAENRMHSIKALMLETV